MEASSSARACPVCGLYLGDPLEPSGAWCSGCLELREALIRLLAEGWVRVWAGGRELSPEEIEEATPGECLHLAMRTPEDLSPRDFRAHLGAGRPFLEDLLGGHYGGPQGDALDGPRMLPLPTSPSWAQRCRDWAAPRN